MKLRTALHANGAMWGINLCWGVNAVSDGGYFTGIAVLAFSFWSLSVVFQLYALEAALAMRDMMRNALGEHKK